MKYLNKATIVLILAFIFQLVYLIFGIEIPEDAAESIVYLDWSAPIAALLTAIGIVITSMKLKNDSSEERK